MVPAGLGISNAYLNYRNTFYWDKNLYPVTHTDYTKAAVTHWLHNPLNQTSPIVESTKLPLERRVWRTYPGRGTTYFEGTTATPKAIAHVLDEGSTHASTFTYNAIGRPLTIADPNGRVTTFAYAANNIDVLTVAQKTGASTFSTIASFTYNDQHRPLRYTDAAGQTTTFTYNDAGQVTSERDALGQNTTYEYDRFGYLARIVNANGRTAVASRATPMIPTAE